MYVKGQLSIYTAPSTVYTPSVKLTSTVKLTFCDTVSSPSWEALATAVEAAKAVMTG